MITSLCFLTWLLLGNPFAPVSDSSEAAFEALKSLVGSWTLHSEGKVLGIKMTYDAASNGSIVTEKFGKELSVFYMDGQDLLMTHFCNGGNQPRLRLQKNGGPGILDFKTFDVTNLKTPDADHVERIIYKLVDANKIELEIVWRVKASQNSEKYTLTKAD